MSGYTKITSGSYVVNLPMGWDPILAAMAKRKRKAEKRLRDLQRQSVDK